MNKAEVLEKIMNSKNGGLYAAIVGIVLVFAFDCITKNNYRADIKKDSFTIEPASTAEKVQIPESDQ